MGYLRLIWMYYDTEQPLPNEPAVLALKVGVSADEVELLLKAFFAKEDDVWRHRRCDAEIAEFHALCERNRIKGRLGGRPPKKPKTNPEETRRVTDGLPVATPAEPGRNPDETLPNNPLTHYPSNTGEERGSTPVASCPHQEILALWAEKLPTAIQPREWTPARSTALKARWRENPKRQSLDWWARFFDYIAESDFLMGRTATPGRKAFELSIDWLLKQENFVKTIEGRYHSKAEATV